jgi:hypothetical protein
MFELAGSISPFEVTLTGLQIVPAQTGELDSGILWIDVQETEFLRGLHNRLNRELEQLLGNAQAPFDGPEYHFHMTVAIGGQPFEVYQKILAEFSGRVVNLNSTVQELALLGYDDEASLDSGYDLHGAAAGKLDDVTKFTDHSITKEVPAPAGFYSKVLWHAEGDSCSHGAAHPRCHIAIFSIEAHGKHGARSDAGAGYGGLTRHSA